MTKRKVTYEQSLALEYGRSVQRRNTRERMAARETAKHAAAAKAEHQHYWADWTLNDDDVTETRKCRCGATETRPWRGL